MRKLLGTLPMIDDKSVHDRSLRQRAEERLKKLGQKPSYATEQDPLYLVHELQVHRIELEIQNEELRRANCEAEELRRRYHDLYDLAPVGYLTMDEQGAIIEANLTSASLLGVDRSVLAGRPLSFFLAPEARKEYDAFLRRLLAGAPTVRCEVHLGVNARRRGWLLLDGNWGAAGRDKRHPVQLALIDITHRKHAEDSLRIAKEKFSLFFNSAPCLLGISTLPEGRCIDVNAAGLKALGYTKEEIVGRTTEELGLWAVPEDRVRMLQCLEEQGMVKNFEVRFKDKSGRQHFGLLSGELIDLDGERHLLSMVWDITERKRSQEEIERLNTELSEKTAKLEEANRELESFNYTVAHDLRKPLSVINGYCQAALEICGCDLSEQCSGYLREAYEGTLAMNELLGVLLDFSRMANCRLKPETVNLSAMATAILTGLRAAEPERVVVVTIAEGVTVMGDPSLLQVALTNLLSNAWKYTGTRDEAIIEFGMAQIAGKEACFVRDNGIGFAQEDAAKIFTPFERLHDPTQIKGHGIGLATVERIIRRHGGRVWAEGEPDKGATFWFMLETP